MAKQGLMDLMAEGYTFDEASMIEFCRRFIPDMPEEECFIACRDEGQTCHHAEGNLLMADYLTDCIASDCFRLGHWAAIRKAKNAGFALPIAKIGLKKAFAQGYRIHPK